MQHRSTKHIRNANHAGRFHIFAGTEEKRQERTNGRYRPKVCPCSKSGDYLEKRQLNGGWPASKGPPPRGVHFTIRDSSLSKMNGAGDVHPENVAASKAISSRK